MIDEEFVLPAAHQLRRPHILGAIQVARQQMIRLEVEQLDPALQEVVAEERHGIQPDQWARESSSHATVALHLARSFTSLTVGLQDPPPAAVIGRSAREQPRPEHPPLEVAHAGWIEGGVILFVAVLAE